MSSATTNDDTNGGGNQDDTKNVRPYTLASYLNYESSIFMDGNVSVETKIETASTLLESCLVEDDAYIRFTGKSHQAHLPSLTNWNGNSGLRKGYSLLMWVRPKLLIQQQPQPSSNNNNDNNNDNNNNNNSTNDNSGGENSASNVDPNRNDPNQRVMYRFGTSTEDSVGTGICVVCSPWKAVPFDGDENNSNNNNNSIVPNDDTNTTTTKTTTQRWQLETMLTAYTLPHFKSNQLPPPGLRSTYVQQPLILVENEWQLLGFSHTQQPAVWSVTVNGRLLGSDKLPYPTLPEKHHVNSMEYCSILHNITSSGAMMSIQIPSSSDNNDKRDYQKTASELQAEAAAANNNNSIHSNNNGTSRTVDFCLDLAALSLYADRSIPFACLAVAADAGPALALQKGGRILPTLPPVANWTKGASLEGPKVGIPLVVHSSALSLQELSSAPHLVFCCSAISARILGSPTGNSTRLVCTMQLQPGSTTKAPRVGLISPAAPLRIPEDELPCLYVVGNVQVHNAIAKFLLQIPGPVAEELSTSINTMSKNLSVAVLDQEILTCLIQPFFLSLCPPGKVFDRHQRLYDESLRHLHALYSNNAKYAARLIKLFSIVIRSGGGRAHEEVLQSGLLHVLASSLRLSLIRASRLKLFQDTTSNVDDFVLRVHKVFPDESSIAPPQRGAGSSSPNYIPPAITEACCELIDTCCGPPKLFLETLSPHHQIKRTSDLALTAIFGLALDLDLWAGYPIAAASILDCVSQRYGGICVTSGFVLRSQISVQHFLDMIRLHFDESIFSHDNPAPKELEQSASHMSSLLQAMLLSALSNPRSQSQSENDISACVSSLCDCPLGSVGAHVILNAIANVLVWCDVLPIEATFTTPRVQTSDFAHEKDKIHVATRLGNNILVAQFHDVIAPMILSRTVCSGEQRQSNLQIRQSTTESTTGICDRCSICWQNHWRLSLLLFSWVTSIAGPKGIIATKTCGNLLLASSHAGTLEYALEKSDKVFISTLFLPSPSMSLLTSHNSRKELNYTDLLADRLETLMPLLPGLVVALLSRLRGSVDKSTAALDTTTFTSLTLLGEIFTSMIGSFQRVYGSLIHSWNKPGITVTSAFQTQKSGLVSQSIKVAKVHVPHLVSLAFFLENHIIEQNLSSGSTDNNNITITRIFHNGTFQGAGRDTSTGSGDVSQTEIAIVFPVADGANNAEILSVLRSCQRSVTYTAAGLIVNSMNAGGCGSTIPLWETLVLTLQQMTHLLANNQLNETEAAVTNPLPKSENETLLGTGVPDSASGVSVRAFKGTVRRLITQIFSKALNQTHPREPWGYELSSSIAHICDWIEKTGLLVHSDPLSQLVDEQIVLLGVILDLMAYGRESTGWCQVFPQSESVVPNVIYSSRDAATQTSKLLLPILRPLLCIVLRCLEFIPPSCCVNISHSEGQQNQPLLELVLSELDLTLTAAIVGLSFSSARETALQALSAIRNILNLYEAAQDETSTSLCKNLITKIAEELRVRYESERQLREKTIFEAYEGGVDIESKKLAADGSQAVERLILGDGIFQAGIANELFSNSLDNDTSAIGRGGGVSDDFVLFHEPRDSDGSSSSDSKLGYEFLNGLGAALELWKKSGDDTTQQSIPDDLLPLLKPFLDAWDVASSEDPTKTTPDQSFWKQNDEPALLGTRNETNVGSDMASDAMSTFFEVAASEKNRLKEISTRFLPSYRYSRMAFADRLCWSRQMEYVPDKDDDWDRGIGDGNRDIRSRIPTVPCFPQFRRYLPKYLDNSSEDSTMAGTAATGSTDIGVPLEQSELGAFTKSLLETGHLEIIDITKRPVDEEEEEPELSLPTTFVNEADEEDNFFADSEGARISENHARPDNSDGKGDLESAMQEPKTEEFQISDEELPVFPSDAGGKGQHNITTSSFSTPPDNASSSLSLLFSAASGLVEEHIENCVHVKAEGTRQCTMLITGSHLILEYDGSIEGFFEGEILARQEEAERQRMVEEVGSTKENDLNDVYTQKSDRRQRELAALRSKSIRWNLTEVSHVYLRRYRLRDTALEIFFIPTGSTSFGGYGLFSPSSSLYIDFGPGYDGIKRRDDAAFAIMRRSPSHAIKQWPDRSDQFLHEQLNRLTIGWVEGRITNFDYLLHLNMLSGRSYNDICQYPVFPWVLSNYTSEEIPDLRDKNNFRDLSKPVGALNEERLRDFLDRFHTFADPSIPPFMYGSHYSTSAGVVLHFLVRLHPFAGLHRQLQGGHFDVADRLFSSVPRTWSMCTGSSAGEVKELTPEWYCNPSFLRNVNKFKLGTSQDGEVINDVMLPPWAKGSPERFVEVMRAALESDVCSDMLSSWVDLIFGKKQQGQAAIDANNVFFYLTYYGTVDVASIEDESLRQATELQIAHFGQCPMQLFKRLHVRRLPRESYDVNFYQVLSAYSQKMNPKVAVEMPGGSDIQSLERPTTQTLNEEPLFLPFFSAPLSHWVHLDAPPPGPHAPLIAIRFAGVDRCLAVDAKGVFHSFRWAWRSEEIAGDNSVKTKQYFDQGCFIAQRELPRFRVLPRLIYSPQTDYVVVAISKTLFASRSVLLVLSDGDGCGSLAMQLVDPAKGEIRGEVMVPQVHSGRITCITTDPIGTAAGHGGVGGELCLVGSADGTASLWRFMSSHYLPLRPRVKFRGHQGAKISAVALCASLHIAVTISADRCCIHSVGNGALIRSFPPPLDSIQLDGNENFLLSTCFANSPAMAVSAQGYIVVVCETIIKSIQSADRTVLTLHMFSIEGVSIGSKPLESWRGVPHKMQCTPDGTAVIVCCGRGVTIHRVSVCQPLEFLDEFQVTESDELDDENVLHSVWDVDFGPSRHRPVAAAAGCSNGVLRLHALPGISAWSERQAKNGLTQTVSSALATPARRINQAVRDGIGFGRQIAGIGRDLSQEVSNDVKERGVSGFLGGIFRKK